MQEILMWKQNAFVHDGNFLCRKFFDLPRIAMAMWEEKDGFEKLPESLAGSNLSISMYQ